MAYWEDDARKALTCVEEVGSWKVESGRAGMIGECRRRGLCLVSVTVVFLGRRSLRAPVVTPYALLMTLSYNFGRPPSIYFLR